MVRASIHPAPRVPRITRLRRQLIRRRLEQQSSDESGHLPKHLADMIAIGAGNLPDEPRRGIPTELAEPTAPISHICYTDHESEHDFNAGMLNGVLLGFCIGVALGVMLWRPLIEWLASRVTG